MFVRFASIPMLIRRYEKRLGQEVYKSVEMSKLKRKRPNPLRKVEPSDKALIHTFK